MNENKGDLISRSELKKVISETSSEFDFVCVSSVLGIIDSIDTPRLCQTPSLYAAEPIKNNYKKVIDCGAKLLECPSCKCRIVLNAFSYAVGFLGYAYCPYCGTKTKKEDDS